MRIWIGVIGLLLGCTPVISAEKQLTPDQKRMDAEYLFQVLDENYPFTGMVARKTGIDWRAEREAYIERLAQTPDDSTYIITLRAIMRSFGDGHFDMSPTRSYDLMLYTYRKAVRQGSKAFRRWVDVLELEGDRVHYWQRFIGAQPIDTAAIERMEVASPNRDTILVDERIGVLRIYSFRDHLFRQDSAMLERFWPKLKDCDDLVIDIQRNGGGSGQNWLKNIVSRLIRDTVVYQTHTIAKKGDMNRYFYSRYTNRAVLRADSTMPRIPPELLDGTYSYRKTPRRIIPRDPIGFTGNIYLLVDQRVFSASESFAIFCKSTGWATVAGQRTKGDGGGSDGIIFSLPQSGILVRHTAVAALNPDGSLNAETATTPDVPLSGNSPAERMKELIRHIVENREN